MRQLALLTRLELGSSLAWMLYRDYGRGGPLTWGFWFGGEGWRMDVLSAPQTYMAQWSRLYRSLRFCLRPMGSCVYVPVGSCICDSSTLLKNLWHWEKGNKNELTYLSLPRPLSCITSCLSYHLASPYPERPGRYLESVRLLYSISSRPVKAKD